MAQVIEDYVGQKSEKVDVVESIRTFVTSQFVLLNCRKRWGIIYAMATLAGLFCIPGTFFTSTYSLTGLTDTLLRVVTLPLSSFFIIVGMYVFNDLVDADLDRTNGKNRPIPKGEVSKLQAWIFIIGTNCLGMALSLVTFNIFTLAISLSLACIGILYSVPKIAFKDRFLVKTLSIAGAMMLCISLGSTSYWNANVRMSLNSSTLVTNILYSSLLLAIMVFITSPFNDVADVVGDRAAGRKTIPIVIGAENTVKMAMILAGTMSIISWIVYYISNAGWVNPLLVSLVSVLTIYNMNKTLNNLENKEYVRKQHKKSMPLHLLLQLCLVVGSLLFSI
ncbi:MAG TPA: UbiA family prenyltransferase [Nitrososphaeraceae archaeon]